MIFASEFDIMAPCSLKALDHFLINHTTGGSMLRKAKQFVFSGNPVLDLGKLFIIIIIVARIILPWEAVPFNFEYFWPLNGSFLQALWSCWPLFLAGLLLNLFKMATTVNPPEVQASAPSIPWTGFLTSVSAGVLEEIVFRWILFYGFMGVIWTVTNVFFPGLEYWVRDNLSWFSPYLVGDNTHILELAGAWTLVPAFFLSNFKFQQGHLYQGITGFIFSWFGGFFFARVFLQYNLFYAILIHFLFDWMIFMMLYIDLVMEVKLGLTAAKNRFYHWYRWYQH